MAAYRRIALLIVEGDFDRSALKLCIQNWLQSKGLAGVLECEVYRSDFTIQDPGANFCDADPQRVMNRVQEAIGDY